MKQSIILSLFHKILTPFVQFYFFK